MSLLARLGLPTPAERAIAAAEASSKPKPRPRRALSESEMREMARWPGEAHRVWKRLTLDEQTAVTLQMAAEHGEVFARKFLEYTRSGARSDWSTLGGPFPEYTLDWFKAHGYELAQKDAVNQWWVHPSGHVMVGQFGVAAPSGACTPTREDQQALDATVRKLTVWIAEANKQKEQIVVIQQFREANASDSNGDAFADLCLDVLLDLDETVAKHLAEIAALKKELSARCLDLTPLAGPAAQLEAVSAWVLQQ